MSQVDTEQHLLDIAPMISPFFDALSWEAVILIVLIAFAVEIALFFAKKSIKKAHEHACEHASMHEISHLDTTYYRKRQLIDALRIGVFLLLALAVVAARIPSIVGVLSFAVGAMILMLKEPLLSLLSYFYLIANYSIGQSVIVAQNAGEIISISIFTTRIMGQDASGESTGQIMTIPNWRMTSEILRFEERHMEAYRYTSIVVIYSHDRYRVQFDEFLSILEARLSEIMPARELKTIPRFRTFVGDHYHLDMTQRPDASIEIMISFVTRPISRPYYQRQVYSLVTSLLEKKENPAVKKAIAGQKALEYAQVEVQTLRHDIHEPH